MSIPKHHQYGRVLAGKRVVTGGILKHLITVKITCFRGRETELDVVRYFLDKAYTLEKMTITYLNKIEGLDADDQLRISEKILSFTTLSPGAVVSFSLSKVRYPVGIVN
ncbi:hypothetical protein IFM89_008651 [Coptis chinensis]|uniref:FBD domain-containing protein n=1 Tax=Coptis chinensis TaxID=261450 RepID=A0A835GVQ4_9MAGN|nr:hypothetical protein IFM89_008651 [Coptis chinensis]